jgi:hypothetical protein
MRLVGQFDVPDGAFDGIIARAGMKKEETDLIGVSKRGVVSGWKVLHAVGEYS